MPNPRRPNIVLAVFDALSEKDGERIGSETHTPTLAKLRDESAFFANSYAPCPESSPARASLFTGLDPCAHGVWTNGVALPARERTFPQILAQSGYSTWLVGRRQLAGVANWTTEHARPDEFSQFAWAHGPLHRSRQNAYLSWLQRMAAERYTRIFPAQANPDDMTVPSEQREAMALLPDELTFNHWVGARLVNMISAHSSDRPYLAIAGFVVGNNMGAEPPQDHDCEGLNELALQQADKALDHILDRMAAAGRAEDTAVVVTAARGSSPSETPGHPLREAAIRVPLVFRHPSRDRKVIDQPASTMDLAPTLLDMAQVPIPPRMQGASLVGVLNGTQTPRGWAMSRLRGHARTWRTALRADHRKLVVSHGHPRTGVPATYKLFDLDADPDEHNDLAGESAHAGDLEAMIDMMIDARCALEDRTEPRIAEF